MFTVFIPIALSGCGQASKKLNFYQINATFDEQNNSLLCEQSVSYVNNSENALSEVCFFVYANAFSEGQKTVSTAYFDKAYPNGESFGELVFESVKIAEQNAQYFLSDDKSILTVNLENQLFPDESIKIDMNYSVNLANINHRLGYGENAINFGNFFPIASVYEEGFVKNKFTPNGDPFYSDVSNFEVTISCPQDYVLATTGVKTEKTENGQKIVTCSAQNVRDFCFVASKNFKVLSETVDGVVVNYYFYEDVLSQEHLTTSVKALQTFEGLFGDYPYKQLSVVQTNFCFGGMEYPNLVMINDKITDNETYNYVIVHEIAHQWWYGMVGNNQYSEPWVDEGLTEFSTALFFERNPEYNFDYDTIMSNATESYKNFAKVFEKINGSVDESMTRNLSEYSTEPEYVNCTYTKGMLLFDALRNSMSERKFFACLRNYFEEYKFDNSCADKLIASFSRSSRINLKKFFSSWLDGNVEIK